MDDRVSRYEVPPFFPWWSPANSSRLAHPHGEVYDFIYEHLKRMAVSRLRPHWYSHRPAYLIPHPARQIEIPAFSCKGKGLRFYHHVTPTYPCLTYIYSSSGIGYSSFMLHYKVNENNKFAGTFTADVSAPVHFSRISFMSEQSPYRRAREK